MRQILLLRHGLTEAGERHLYCGSTDLPLSDRGIRDLQMRRRKGEKTPKGYPSLDGFFICSSGMQRTLQTLFLLYGIRDAAVIKAFQEVDFGIFEMHSYAELKDRPVYQKWLREDPECVPAPEGESGRQMKERVIRTFRHLEEKKQKICLVSHGGPIACLMQDFFPEEARNRYEWQPPYGEGYWIRDSEEGMEYKRIPEITRTGPEAIK